MRPSITIINHLFSFLFSLSLSRTHHKMEEETVEANQFYVLNEHLIPKAHKINQTTKTDLQLHEERA